MSFVKLPYPEMVTNDALEPERINANFRALAQVVNGRLGAENVRRAGPGLDALQCDRSSVSVYVPLTGMMGGPNNMNAAYVFIAPVEMMLLGVGVVDAVPGLTGDVGLQLLRELVGTDELVAELEPPSPGMPAYWITRLNRTVIPAYDALRVEFTVANGAAGGLVLELRAQTYSESLA